MKPVLISNSRLYGTGPNLLGTLYEILYLTLRYAVLRIRISLALLRIRKREAEIEALLIQRSRMMKSIAQISKDEGTR